MGLLILVLSLIMLEGLLNYTSYIFKVLWLTNFSEPFTYMLIKHFLHDDKGSVKSVK